MTRPQHRINEREAEVRRRQPIVKKMIVRLSCILAESGKLDLDGRILVANRMELIAAELKNCGSHPINKANVSAPNTRTIGH